MMSSSKIIKSGAQHQLAAINLSFETLSELPASAVETDKMETNGFIRIIPGAESRCSNSAEARQELNDDPVVMESDLTLPAAKQCQVSEEKLNEMRRECFDDGFREGVRQAEERLATGCKALFDAIEQLGCQRERLICECEEDLVRLAVTVAKKIIQQEISQDRRVVANIINAAVRCISDRGEITIRLNPHDYRVLDENKHLYLPGVTDERLSLRPDETVPCGGCMVDTAMGAIDARIETQLEEICHSLLGGRSGGGRPWEDEEEMHDAEEC